MTPDRCPACNAAVTANAQWCTLCYASLRVPETVPAGASAEAEAEAATAPAAEPAPAAPLALHTPVAPDHILDAPVMLAPAVARQPAQGWPCLGCGVMVPLADNACPKCFRPFLAADALPTLELPGVGDLTRMSRGQRILIASIIASVVSGLLLAVAYLAGAFL